MMVYISKITTQKKQTDRFNIYVDDGNGEKYAFSVDEDVLIKYQLKKGIHLDEFTQMEVLYQDTIRKALGVAIQYLAHRMRSEKEVRDYLVVKEVEAPVIQEVIHRLYNLSYLNDEEFALAFVRTQINTNDKGPTVVKMELREKGVADPIIDKVLDEFTFDLQLEKVQKLCQKAFSKKRTDSRYVFEQKLKLALQRKGHSFAIIEEVLRSMVAELDSEDNPEMDAIRKQGEKAVRKFGSDHTRIKQFLYRKGFSVEQIEEYLVELEIEE
ncbi:recombination regulator RecX [Pseudoneobacillus sp. C159]